MPAAVLERKSEKKYMWKSQAYQGPLEWLVTNFSLQYHTEITHWGYENKGNDHQPT